LQVCLLASGSKGNAVFVASRETRILIDAGLSARELKSRLGAIGVAWEDLDAILVTHEHGDHCRGLGPLARACNLPVYVHADTRAALPNPGRLAEVREFDGGTALCWRDLRIEPFPLTHDAVAPVGYAIETPEGKVGVATDLGIATRLVADRLKGCRALVLESNHDEEMLRDGPYPWHLKQRIRSNHGHLSNTASAQLLQEILWDGLEAVFLAHLSEVNNHPGLAEASARAVLSRQNLCQPILVVGSQTRPSACFTV